MPPPVGPMSRYGGPHRRGLRLVGKALLWLVVVVLVAAGALGGGVWLYLNESVAAIRASDPEVIKAEDVLDAIVPGEPTTAIIIGYDQRKGIEADVTGRSDTVMLLRADPAKETVSLLSFPRDLVVDIPGCQGHSPWRDRINTAYTLCGPLGTVRTVKQLTGIPINYIIVVNFRGFIEIVNKVGGVYIDVDRRYFNDNSSGADYATIDLRPGYQRLWGGEALDYARFRHTDSDFHRIARQQAFVKAFKQQVQASFSLLKLPGIINAIVDSIDVGKGGKEKLRTSEVLGYARFIYGLPSGHFFHIQIPAQDLTGYAELTTPPEAIAAVVHEFLNPDVEAAAKATQVAAGKEPKTEAPLPADTTIEVLNGNGVDGSASTAAYLLSQLGYAAGSGGDALDASGSPKWDYFDTKILYNPDVEEAAAAALEVGNLFGDAAVEEAPPDEPLETMLRVIVGQTFKGTLAPAPRDATPEHQPAAVEEDSADTAALVRQDAQRRVDFAVLVPKLRASGSILDPEVPLRVYRLDKHWALRLVFRTGAPSYWGIEETSLTDAPILSGPNVRKQVGGRTLQLYYNGSKLHMVAFEENGAVYWVSNTLLDDLSNETMIAIAKSLKPLAGAG